MGEEFDDEEELLVAFHKHAYALGEHYNSIVPLDAPDVTPDMGERVAGRKNKKNKEKVEQNAEEDEDGEDDEGSDLDDGDN